MQRYEKFFKQDCFLRVFELKNKIKIRLAVCCPYRGLGKAHGLPFIANLRLKLD